MKSKQTFTAKSDIGFKPFSIKSSLIIAVSGLLTSFIIPVSFGALGIDTRIVTLLANMFLLSFAVCYTRFFIDGKEGFSKRFKTTYLILAGSFGLITYFWVYLKIFI